MLYFREAHASEYLVITGYRIKDIKLVKKAWILPGQACSRFDISPVNYTFEVQAMSSEKLLFILQEALTIGPRTDDSDALLKYAKLISRQKKQSNHVKGLVQRVIEEETCVLAASMTMEGIFTGTKEFKQTVLKKVQIELNQFGLNIYTSILKLLVDVCGSEYFSFLGQKTQQEAANQAKVDVAETRMEGDIGATVREREMNHNVAEVDAETRIYLKQREGEAKRQEVRVMTEVKIYKNKREAEVDEVNDELAKKKASCARETMVAQFETTNPVASAQIEVVLVDPPNISAMVIPLAHPPTSSGEDTSLQLETFNPHSTTDSSEDDESKRLFELAQSISVAALALVLIVNTPESVKHNLLSPYNAYFVSLHLSLFVERCNPEVSVPKHLIPKGKNPNCSTRNRRIRGMRVIPSRRA